MLNVMEAHVALMELENVRILKEMRNSVNRKVNCETANINKTVSAAVKQVEDITYLRDTVGFDHLPDNLVEAAIARLEHPDATLKELGEVLDPPWVNPGSTTVCADSVRWQRKLSRSEEDYYDKNICCS